MATQPILEFLKYNKRKDIYEEKITEISLLHLTGLITARTTLYREFSVKITDLIPQLKIDQIDKIIERDAVCFNDVIQIKFSQSYEKSKKELEKVVTKSGISILAIIIDPVFKFQTAIVAVRPIPVTEETNNIVIPKQKPLTAFVELPQLCTI